MCSRLNFPVSVSVWGMLSVPSPLPRASQSLSSVKESDWVISIEILLETDFLITWPFYQYSKHGMMLGMGLKGESCKIWETVSSF